MRRPDRQGSHRTSRQLLGIALAVICLLIVATGASVIGWQLFHSRALPTAVCTPIPAAETTPLPDAAEKLAQVPLPQRDSRSLAERLQPGTSPIPEVVRTEPLPRKVGDSERFWVSNADTNETFEITATLRYISKNTYMWVQEGLQVDQQDLERSARVFDERIYPTVHRYFGSEWTPGIDGDPRIAILNARFSGATGYFSSQDETPRQASPYSNEREMFYMNIDAARPGSDYYNAVLAHEFQHMVHYHLDANEESWINEGSSELAAQLCGYGASDAITAFASEPDTQLNAWTLSPDEESFPHYGASYLFMAYFLERMGADALRALIAEPANGIEGFQKVLSSIQDAPTFDELYADWVIANLLDDPSLTDGRYSYPVTDPRVNPRVARRSLPAQGEEMIAQYGSYYISIPLRGEPVQVAFTGTIQTPLVPNKPLSGRYQWWSNRGDMSDTSLTRALDLRGLKKATLQYSAWYEIEDGWDYAYIAVSTDNGAHWTLLTTPHTTEYNPNGTAYGPGYTGYSGHAPGAKTRLEPQWIREQIDLTPYAGQQILLRFEMVTDDAVNLPGLCLDDITIPELGFHDDAEEDVDGWQSAGFVRTDNTLRQRWLVQVIAQGPSASVQRLDLDENQRGTLRLDNLPQGTRSLVLVISGLTRFTTEPAQFAYSVTAAAP